MQAITNKSTILNGVTHTVAFIANKAGSQEQQSSDEVSVVISREASDKATHVSEGTGTAQKKNQNFGKHVIVQYTETGKLIIRFVDSKNNSIYQTPPEQVAKMEELMTGIKVTTDSRA